MKKASYLLSVLCVCLLLLSAAAAEDYDVIKTVDGVRAMVKYNPLGYNNAISAFLKFVNDNKRSVKVDWTPTTTCTGGVEKEGYGESFELEAGGVHEVTIWKLQACGPAQLSRIKVEMTVK